MDVPSYTRMASGVPTAGSAVLFVGSVVSKVRLIAYVPSPAPWLVKSPIEVVENAELAPPFPVSATQVPANGAVEVPDVKYPN